MVSKAQDWAQWRGENREGIVKATGLNLDWSEKKPQILWTYRQAGAGYSAPTIVRTTLYCQGASEGSDFAFALDTRTGKLKWHQVLGAEFIQDRGNGPRGSVTVDGDKVFLIRGGGQIHCLSAADGQILWTKDLIKDFGGKIMSEWGFSESPLIDGNLLICTPGGVGGTLIALDKNTGNLIWKSKEWTDDAGYSSPVVVEVEGVRQYIQQSSKGVAGVLAKDGKLLWRVEIDGYRGAVIATPVYFDHTVFVTSWSANCAAIRLTKMGEDFKSDIVYMNKNLINHHGGVVLVNGYIYGFADGLGWTCLNFKTGEVVWRHRVPNDIFKGAVIAVQDRLLLLDEKKGLLVVAAASPEGWKEYGRMDIPERSKVETMDNMVWAHPVIADGKLFLRDQDLLFCFNLAR